MFSLFSCKNCKDANIELAQAKDELFKLKIENKRSSGELAQAKDELLKVNSEKQRLHQEFQKILVLPQKNLLNPETEIDHLREELREIKQYLDSSRYELLKLKVENKRLFQEMEATQPNTIYLDDIDNINQPIPLTPLPIEPESPVTVPSQISPRYANESKVIYIASWNRTHFHRPNCVWMENMPESKLRKFYSHEEAVKAGCRPCKTCCA